mmetsp:Transcript_21981/g.52127  ORF Transcript_21981/g.52127 Transcript_21981/m.52127 type:complete len:85 (+) Transcript_21981:1546-1800(+)
MAIFDRAPFFPRRLPARAGSRSPAQATDHEVRGALAGAVCAGGAWVGMCWWTGRAGLATKVSEGCSDIADGMLYAAGPEQGGAK